MKSIKTIALAAALVAAGSVASNAQTRINFTGSTANRAATVNAIHNIFDNGTLAYAYTTSGASTAETSANAAVYSGQISGQPYIIKTFWTGSEAGIQAVGQDSVGIALNFVSDSPSKGGPGNDQTLVIGSPVAGIDDPTSGVSGDYTSVVPDVDLADSYQASSQFHGSYQGHSYPNLTGVAATGNTLGNGIVGVVPFEWVADGSATFTNMTDMEARALYSAGKLPKALFTGNHSDETSFVYAVGRDPDSGTRVTAFSDTGIGTTKSVFQYEPLTSGSALISATGVTIASLVPWPTETVDGITITSPDGGYNSGGKEAGALGSSTAGMVIYNSVGAATGTGGNIVGYLGTSDAATAIGGGGNALTYNGYAYSVGNIEEGMYSFWGYEHMYYRTLAGTATTGQKGTVTAIATSLYSTYATILVANMHVKRTIDGGNITNTY